MSCCQSTCLACLLEALSAYFFLRLSSFLLSYSLCNIATTQSVTCATSMLTRRPYPFHYFPLLVIEHAQLRFNDLCSKYCLSLLISIHPFQYCINQLWIILSLFPLLKFCLLHICKKRDWLNKHFVEFYDVPFSLSPLLSLHPTFERVSHISHCLHICRITPLLPSSQGWGYRGVLSCPDYVVLGIKPQALCMLGEYSMHRAAHLSFRLADPLLE